MPELIDRKQASEALRVGVVSIDRLRKSGKLPFIRIGRLVRFTPEDIEKCIENLKVST